MMPRFRSGANWRPIAAGAALSELRVFRPKFAEGDAGPLSDIAVSFATATDFPSLVFPSVLLRASFLSPASPLRRADRKMAPVGQDGPTLDVHSQGSVTPMIFRPKSLKTR